MNLQCPQSVNDSLVWFAEKKRYQAQKTRWNVLLKLTFSKYGLFCFAGLIILFAYLEEGLWDGLVWREHPSVFHFLNICQPLAARFCLLYSCLFYLSRNPLIMCWMDSSGDVKNKKISYIPISLNWF